MKRILLSCMAAFSLFPVFAEELGEKKLITNESGFIVCNGGGTNNPLFSKDCKTLNVVRISSAGGIKYEGNCVDSNGINFFLACDAINFEYNNNPTDGRVIKK